MPPPRARHRRRSTACGATPCPTVPSLSKKIRSRVVCRRVRPPVVLLKKLISIRNPCRPTRGHTPEHTQSVTVHQRHGQRRRAALRLGCYATAGRIGCNWVSQKPRTGHHTRAGTSSLRRPAHCTLLLDSVVNIVGLCCQPDAAKAITEILWHPKS